MLDENVRLIQIFGTCLHLPKTRHTPVSHMRGIHWPSHAFFDEAFTFDVSIEKVFGD